MTAAPAPRRPKSDLKTSAQRFWNRVSEGLEVNQLWSQLQKDARSSYRFYSAGIEEHEPGLTRGRRFFATAKALFWAIIEKLSPARRVLLLASLVLLFFPAGGFEYTNRAGHIESFQLDLHVWGGVLMFIVLLLELADRVVMKRDLEIARDIQAWLLPGAPLQLSGYQIGYATRPANTVAGDYYDVILRTGANRADDRVLFVVADVAGKSIPAAMLMATFQASLRTLSTSSSSLLELVTNLNHYACTNSQGGVRFTTAFFAELDPVSGSLIYVNAGHNAPLLRSASGSIEHLSTGGLPIGILAGTVYEAGSATMKPGEWLVIFTDGVVEAVNSNGQEYEESRLTGVIERCAGTTPAELLRSLLADLDAYVGNTPQHDDMTCLLVKRLGV
jgi:sigma-B regulation protein RsbU (phosphoserine phosphatase)